MLSRRLSQFQLFSGVEASILDPLEPALIERRIPANSLIFQAGEEPLGFYLVLDGRIKVFRDSYRGQEQVLGFFGPGESFAEAALFQNGYPASAATMVDSLLIFVQRDRFLRGLADHPELSMRLIVGLARKQKRLVNLIEDLTLRDARGRLCHYLSGLLPDSSQSGSVNVRIPVSQVALAQLLGVTEETLSRSIRSLRQDGVLESSAKGRFVVGDVKKLKTAYAI